MADLENTLKLISDASDRLTQSYDYQRGVLDERARCAEQANTIEELRAANERWVIAFKQAEAYANGRIEALQAENAKLRDALFPFAEFHQLGGSMNDPISMWFRVAPFADAAYALQETER